MADAPQHQPVKPPAARLVRIGLARKGGRGKRVMKVQDDDEVVSACVVSGIQEPLKPLAAWQLYAKDHPEVSEASFEDISADIRQPFQQQADEMKQRYTDELEKYQKEDRVEDNEELLLGSSSGAVTRIKVSSVLVTDRLIRGRVVAKTKSDRISVATLLSSMDGDPEEAAKPQEPSQPSQKPLDVSMTSADAQPAPAVSTASRPRGRPRGKPSATETSTSAPQTSPSTSPSEPSQPSQPSQPAMAEPAPTAVANQPSPGLQSPSLRRRRLSVSQLQQRPSGLHVQAQGDSASDQESLHGEDAKGATIQARFQRIAEARSAQCEMNR
eukprot:s1175_g9.t1